MEQNINIPQTGMTFTHPSMIKEGQFLLLLNGNIQNVSGDFALISNDNSNILGTKFKEGYKVIGTLLVPSLSLTFFFLTNPVTNDSEIGWIFDAVNIDQPDVYSQVDNKIIESTPLELITQSPNSVYNTFVNAKCLNFDIDHPVSSWVKIDDCNIRIYFNDFKNPPRYIDYDNFPKVNLSNCPLIETQDLDCDKILIFPESCYPKIDVIDVISGGQNKAGVYQFAICYSDVNSNKVTDYYYVTNPIPLFDKPITIPTDYPVAKSFKLQITNLNTDFKYFNLSVIKTINNVSTPYLIETFDINGSSFEYIYTGNDKNIQQNLSLDDILSKRPYYNKAKLITESNGYSIMGILEEDRILNLQPVVSEISPKWQTIELNDGDYKNPIIAQNYVGYLGDEIYALGIAFTKTNGKQTNIFPFVGREATPLDLIQIDNNDVITPSSCITDKPNKNWQVYNTASVIGSAICVNTTGEGTPIPLQDILDCYSDNILMDNTNPVSPKFYLYPPNTVAYPPTTSQEIQDFFAWLSTQPQINPVSPVDQDLINLCICDDYLPQYPTYPDPSLNPTATSLPVITDTTNPNSSVISITQNSIISVNTYNVSNGISPSAINYPYSPSPCDATLNDDGIPAYVLWLNQKTNYTFENATLLAQSSTNTCQIDTWGAFIADPVLGDESWYTFYCSNTDGVAGISISTDSLPTDYTITFYPVNPNGSLGTALTYTQNGNYYLLQNLNPGGQIIQYAIRIKTTYPYPPFPSGHSCKAATFRICVNSPKPISSTTLTIPGVAQIVKQCQIDYYGFPQNSCVGNPDKYGEFAYWESTELYPCNEEVWGNLANKPIRHFKFPDHKVIPFFTEKGATINQLSVKTNKIYPKGFIVDINEIKNALNKAVNLGLITPEERNQICGYRLYRSNRRGNNSIVAKGLLYDVWKYRDNIYNTGNEILFPNFPFNDNRPNEFIKTQKVNSIAQINDTSNYLTHPYNTLENNRYTFDAPNLSFNNPGLGTELKLECEQYGKAIGNYVELKNNSKYQYLGAGVISAAVGFASVEAAFEALNVMVQATLTLNVTIFGSGTTIPLGLILAAVGENILAPMRIYSHYAEWYDIIKKFAPFRNYAIYYIGTGNYVGNSLVPIGNTRRTIINSSYLQPGILNIQTTKGSTRFNNFQRDKSVFFELEPNSFFLPTVNQDTSRQNPQCDISIGVDGNVASYYASLKNYTPNQYGQIDNIEWIDTGYNGVIDWTNPNQNTLCDTVFGGDTYITRFSKKRKIPLFLDDRVVPSDATNAGFLNQDIQLSLLPNVGYPRYFMDYPAAYDYTGITNALFGDVAIQSNSRVDYNFICKGSDGKAWQDAGLTAAILGSFAGASFGIISLPITVGVITGKVKADLGNDIFLRGKYLHSFYGISSFLCESDYNLELQHGENIKEKNFPRNVGDIIEWTQQYFVPISEDNYYIYNNDYSLQNTLNPNFVLNNDFSQSKSDCKTAHTNRLIYSLQDNDQNDIFDGNLVFLANNRIDLPKSAGKISIIKGLDTNRILVIQENQASVFNSFSTLKADIKNVAVGSGALFNQQLQQYVKTDLGFGGSQTQAVVTTEYGTYWVDNKRAQIIELNQGINNIIKPEEQWWFNENLPFHILEDFPDYDVTNNFKYIGMAIVYDSRYKRIIFTKKDVELRPEYKNKGITYDGKLFHFGDETFSPELDKYFINKSWTISYSPVYKSFISFHSFIPNFYVSNQNYFSSGVNYSYSTLEEGSTLWHHNLTNKSYQVYNGILYPFMFEYSIATKLQNKQLESIRYFTDFYRFQDNLSSGLIPNITYNQALIYNQKQTSGLLELIPKEKNNRQQFLQYPIQNLDSRSILVDYVERGWNFNNFYDVAIQNSGQPLLSFQDNNIAYKELNPLSISYTPQYLKRKLVSDWFVIRLINNKYSNYLINHRYSLTQTNNINN